MKLVFLVITLSALGFGNCGEFIANNTATYCAYFDPKVTTSDTGEPLFITSENSSTVEPVSVHQCQGDGEFCYTLWYINPVNRTHTVLKQGCWDHPDENECPETDCIARTALLKQNVRNNTRFCCCRGNLCNVNVTDVVNLTAYDLLLQKKIPPRDGGEPYQNVLMIGLICGAVAFVVIVGIGAAIFVVRSRALQKQACAESDAFLAGSDSSCGSSSCGSDLDGLEYDALISHGRYGDVYLGLLRSTKVAVKILNATQYRCYINERDILSMASVRHPGIVDFRGCREERLPSGSLRYIIVTAYEPLGSLTDFLKHKTVDWVTACKMCHSVSSGLAHLHTENYDCDPIKPTIVHRDVNSRNVLVRSDLSCCLCDLGFAMKISAPRINDSGVASEDNTSITDVGTLRYMAPEVLEGSVNLCDCRMALSQVDVYALGLVFWEIGTRCHDLYQGLPTPAYQLPFETQVGLHPSFEDMQVAVARNKLRPPFPDTWKDTNLAIKALKDTIEECWDHDAEARISAVCAEERTREMPLLWEMRYKGLQPSAIFLKDLEDKAVVQHNLTSSITNYTADSTLTVDTTRADRDTDLYPATEAMQGKADCNVALARSGAVQPPLMPRNAQNPTVERNTHWSSSEELEVEGNTLVVRRPGTGKDAPTASSDSRDNTSGQSQHQPSSRRISATRPSSAARLDPHQITFVQNAVEAGAGSNLLPPSAGPKRQNVPGNGRSEHQFDSLAACNKGSPSVSRAPQQQQQCEVVLVNGVASTTLARPVFLPVGSSELRAGTAAEPAVLDNAGIDKRNAAVPNAGGQDVAMSSRANVRSQPPVEQSRSVPCSDNFGFESSTSPRYSYPTTSFNPTL